MSKLTPPALQNLKRREDFFKIHPEYPGAKQELNRIAKIREYNLKKFAKSKQTKNMDGAEYYRQLQAKENKSPVQKQEQKKNLFGRLMNKFTKGRQK